MAFAQLGDIQFEGLTSPRSWSESHGATFGEIPHVGRKPALQYTGETLVTLDLSIRLSEDFCDVSETLTKLHQYKTNGNVLPLITGLGVLVGRFVITSIDNKIERTSPDGGLIAISLDVSLKEYVQPPGSKDAQQGEAITGFRNPQRPANPITSPARGITNALSKAKGAVNGIKSVLKAIQRGAKTLKQGVRQASRLSNTAKMAYNDATLRVSKTKKIAKRAQKLPTSLDEAIMYADNLSKIGDVTNTATLERSANQLFAASDKVEMDAAPVTAFAATREGGD